MTLNLANATTTDQKQQAADLDASCPHKNELILKPVIKSEMEILLDQYITLVKQERFRPREMMELLRVIRHHFFLWKNNEVIGGCSLIPRNNERHIQWTELATIWTKYPGQGHGRLLAQKWNKVFDSGKTHRLYALSTPNKPGAEARDKMIDLFAQYGMEYTGWLPDLQQEKVCDLPEALQQYDTSTRKPFLFTRSKNSI